MRQQASGNTRHPSNGNTTDRTVRTDMRTAPPGMQPDQAHASRKPTGAARETEREETFDSSSNNAGSKQSERAK
jgi:hypothetical protein